MARRSQCSSAGDNPLDPNYLPPHYREEYRLAIDALVEEDLEGYYRFLQKADVVDFLSTPEIQHIQSSVQSPQQSSYPEHNFRDIGGDGSSDTYWPLHTDLDVPGLDLGWPQMHHFIGPTEVTTLVNPPEPDMPSIKEQARRLIKNAQQVIAIVMDTFTDVDIFADILNAAMRNVAVYIILDEQNATHFLDMVSNYRVNLQNMQFLRVRTVPGITYQCRSGKSFKGQLMDRFLLTDCRAVLSGNYSFMWSFEKLHRCMAHLFLGQLVTTFDEEFRILFAQSQPLVIDNIVGQIEDLGPFHKRQYPSERISLYREPKTFLDSGHSDEWGRHSYDDRIEGDWMKPLKRVEAPCGPVDMYTRFPSQKPRVEQTFEPGPFRIPVMENPPFKRHSFAEGAQERYPYHFLQQQGLPDSETHGRYFHRGQQSYPGPGQEADYTVSDKFWNQEYLSTDQYSEPQQMQPPDSFDPVLNYLSTARALDVDQSSEKQHGRDLGFLHTRRSSIGQRYSCQTSPTPSNPSEQKQFFHEPNTDRKDPSVKRGLRNWRISSYLSAYDNPEDDGLPMAAPQGSDPFEETSYTVPDITPGSQLTLPKIPNVREFKVPAIPRVSQMPSYAKAITQEKSKNEPDEPGPVPVDTKTTPTPSESSTTTESEKADEAEQKEPKTSALRREDSFRRNYNAAQPRASRLRSSLIFHSLDQQTNPQDAKTTGPDQQVEESDKGENEQPKPPFLSQVLGQRRTAREPFEWSRYLRSSTFDNPSTDSKPETKDTEEADKDSKDPPKDEIAKDLSEKPRELESLKLPEVGDVSTSPTVPRSKQSEAQQSSTQIQPPPFLSPLLELDMNDADNRLKFFKELAAQRKAKKAVEAEKSKEKPLAASKSDPQENNPIKTEPVPKDSTKKQVSTFGGLIEKHATTDEGGKTSTGTEPTVGLSLETRERLIEPTSGDKNDSLLSQGCNTNLTEVCAKLKKSELESTEMVPKIEVSQSESTENPRLTSPTALQQSKTCPSPTSTVATSISPSSSDLPSDQMKSVIPSSIKEPEFPNLNLNPQKSEIIQDEPACSPPLKSVQDSESPCERSKFVPHFPTLDGLSDSQSNSDKPSNSNTLPSAAKTKPRDPLSSSSPSAEGMSPVIALETPSVSEANTSILQLSSGKASQQVSDSTIAAKDVNVDSVKQGQGISNSEKDAVPETVSDLVKGGDELGTTVLTSVTVSAVDPETGSVIQSVEPPESAGNADQDENVPEDVFNLEKCGTDHENVVLNSDKEVSQPERVYSYSNEIVAGSQKEVVEVEDINKAEPLDCVTVVLGISEDLKPTNVLSSQNVETSKPKMKTVCPVDMHSDKPVEAVLSGTTLPVCRSPTHDDTQLDECTSAQGALKQVTPLTVTNASVGDTVSSSETLSFSSSDSPKTSEKISQNVESDIPGSMCGDLKPNIASPQSPTKTIDETVTAQATVSKTESQKDNLESDKDIADSVEDVPKSKTDVLVFEQKDSVSETVSISEEDPVVAEGVSESDKDMSVQEQMASEYPTCLIPNVKDTSATPCPNLSIPNSDLHGVEIAASDADLAGHIPLVHSSVDSQSQNSSSQTNSSVITDTLPKGSQSETTTPLQDQETQISPPPNPSASVCDELRSCEAMSYLPSSAESDRSVLPSEAKIAEAPTSPVHSVPDTKSLSSDPNNLIQPTSANSPSGQPETNFSVPVEKSNLKNPEPMISEKSTQDQIVLTENGKIDETEKENAPTKDREKTVDGVTEGSEKTNDSIKPNHSSEQTDITSRHSKPSQSRYHSSTANVLSSSNLRDDTKLLLGQISANSQSRNESNKDSPVTDDEKEDEADKNAQKEKYKSIRTFNRVEPKSSQERDKVLERIQCMRKERKVYSRFEV